MRKLTKNMFKRFLIFLTIFSLIVTAYLLPQRRVQAASLTSMSDTMSRLQTSTLSSHDILATLQGANTFAAGDTIVVDFDEDGGKFTVADSGWVVGDFDFNDGTERIIANITQGVTPSNACTGFDGANNIGVEVDTDNGTITFRACNTYTASSAGATINMEIGSAAAGPGTDRITNPATAGSTPITITETADSGTLAVPIMNPDQVTVTATVDPTITSTLSSLDPGNSCALGVLNSTSIQTCDVINTVTTNATNGYVSMILDDGNLRTSGGADINDAGVDNDIDQGSEEYGVGTSKAGQTIVQNATCPDPETDPAPASAITTSAQQYASASGPVSADATTLCFAASISGTTPAGSYSHTTTHITTGTF